LEAGVREDREIENVEELRVKGECRALGEERVLDPTQVSLRLEGAGRPV
jgi:hypothetical protein